MSYLNKYGLTLDPQFTERTIQAIHDNLNKWMSKPTLIQMLGLIDLTTLNATDTPTKVSNLVNKVNLFQTNFPNYPNPASICVYPNFASLIRQELKASGVGITTVAGCFPASQSYPEVKVLESKLAVENGATEVDIVLALNAFMDKNFEASFDEIAQIRKAIPSAHLKVILETGALLYPELIAEASFLAMEAGADFIKTSTGKMEPAATPAAAIVMCQCIKRFYEVTGKKIGFKPAGGISSAKDAACYYAIVETILGSEWLCPELLRFGASRVTNNILSELEERTVTYY
ncbi:MAG: deoxyribose-phosphate aldolase [Bacteroidales bacterium]|nr:deoxyribose-phosphate aldolase [Bacteroidales bacterium]